MVFKGVVGFAFVVGIGSSAAAQGANLNGDALRQALAGKTVLLHTPVGSIPISYQSNGTMSGRARSMQMYVGSEQDNGHWWIKADQVCQKWTKWLEGKSHCFTLRLDGRVVHWRSTDGRTGTATIASN